MAVAIKLKRVGKSLTPIYRVVVIDSKKRTGGAPIEEVGQYNPRNKKNTSLNIERIKYWQQSGAIVSETVKSLLKKTTMQTDVSADVNR
ncbi:MAG: 30S ribosomal protein S16 [Elusimicrobia bacterium]|nr:30S ribosomal protein S16 [Elusimicrobiota bacterium]